MATKKKALKKSKLRHAEYYDFQKIQDKLYAESMDGKMFTKLVEIITLPENIKLAYRNIKKNKGSKTAGTDGKTIQHLEKLSEEKLVVLVQRKFSWYVPQSVRRVEIPKDNGKTRPLGIPTIMDRLVQQCVLQVLEPICEAKFHDHSYGFRPNRSQQHAISQVHKNMQLSHLHYVVDIDIKGFFDNVSHATIEYNDNRLSLYSAQMGKCAVTGAKLMIGDIFCHHKVPRCNGGTDAYQNLILLCGNAHRLIHATDTDTIARLTDSLNLTPKQKTKVDKLRSLVHVESC